MNDKHSHQRLPLNGHECTCGQKLANFFVARTYLMKIEWSKLILSSSQVNTVIAGNVPQDRDPSFNDHANDRLAIFLNEEPGWEGALWNVGRTWSTMSNVK